MKDTVFKIAIYDSEKTTLKNTENMVCEILKKEWIDYEICLFETSISLLDAIEKGNLQFHLLLLDIVVEGLNSITLARKLRQKKNEVMIVFLSYSMEYALKGYEVNAKRYLMKPIEKKPLEEAILYCYELSCKKKEVFITTKTALRKLSIEEIYYIEVRGRGTNLVLDSYVVESNSKISDYQKELLSCNFIRCHQGFLVNLSYIEGIKRYELTLKGGRKLPISKLRFDETRQRLFSYLSMKK